MSKQIIDIPVLPGQPTNGTGKVCIHLFVRDERGPFTETHVLRQVDDNLGAVPTRGRLACDPRRTVAPIVRGAVVKVTPRTDDPRAVTCLKCKASLDYQTAMAAYGG